MMVASTVYIRISSSNQNKIGSIRSWPVHVVHWAHGPNNGISVDFKERHFELRVNQELTKSHMDFFGVIIGFFIQKNMDLETKILSLSILDAE